MKVLTLPEKDYQQLRAALERDYNFAVMQVHLCNAFYREAGVHWHARAYWRRIRRKYWRLLKATE